MTIASRAKILLPTRLQNFLEPYWNIHRANQHLKRLGGKITYDNNLKCWVLSRPITPSQSVLSCVHNYKEFSRAVYFGRNTERDVVWKWIHWIKDCRMLYDVGSANGLEGFLANALHGSNVTFFEPYTPNIVTLLKTIYALQIGKKGSSSFEVFHAACDVEPGYAKLYMHFPPIPGHTRNTVVDKNYYTGSEIGPRDNVVSSQWIASLSLDEIVKKAWVESPTHVKIDVDGFEDRVVRGSSSLISDGHVRSWAIELNGEKRVRDITKFFERSGYINVDSYEHHPEHEFSPIDRIFVKPDLVDSWNNFSLTGD